MMWDLRLALRTLMRTPVFTAITVALLALGMGAAIAVFAVVDAVLLKALPYPEPDRIVTIWEATDQSRAIAASNPNFQDWQQAATSFASMFRFQATDVSAWTLDLFSHHLTDQGVYLWEGMIVEDDVFLGPQATFTNDRFPRSLVEPDDVAIRADRAQLVRVDCERHRGVESTRGG